MPPRTQQPADGGYAPTRLRGTCPRKATDAPAKQTPTAAFHNLNCQDETRHNISCPQTHERPPRFHGSFFKRNEALSACLSYVSGWPAPAACEHSQWGGTSQQAHACSRSLLHWTSSCTVTDGPDTQRIFRPVGRGGERRAVR